MIMKQEHKKFKKENKRLKETVENLACGSKDHSTGSGSNSDDYQRIKRYVLTEIIFVVQNHR